MKFQHRLAYYLFGFLVGALFLSFFLTQKKTTFCYMPNCRVLKELRSKPLVFSDEINEMIVKKTITTAQITFLFENGDVVFSKSKVRNVAHKTYFIQGKISEKQEVELVCMLKNNQVILEKLTKI